MEAYISCAMPPESRVVHLMGAPTETRHLIVTNEINALGPPRSIHAGAGIRNYRFIPAMADGNVDFTDMDILYAKALL
jgi:4-deoxy-L-threo-5-hexosulose-uronate ketol-isomerase